MCYIYIQHPLRTETGAVQMQWDARSTCPVAVVMTTWLALWRPVYFLHWTLVANVETTSHWLQYCPIPLLDVVVFIAYAQLQQRMLGRGVMQTIPKVGVDVARQGEVCASLLGQWQRCYVWLQGLEDGQVGHRGRARLAAEGRRCLHSAHRRVTQLLRHSVQVLHWLAVTGCTQSCLEVSGVQVQMNILCQTHEEVVRKLLQPGSPEVHLYTQRVRVLRYVPG